MNVSVSLSNGGSVIVYDKPGGLWFERLTSAVAQPQSGPPYFSVPADSQVSAFSGSDPAWFGATATNAGFSVYWETSGGQLLARDYDLNGAALDAAHGVTVVPADTGGLAYTSATGATAPYSSNGPSASAPVLLSDRGEATATNDSSAHTVTFAKTSLSGQRVGQPYVASAPAGTNMGSAAVNALQDGGYIGLVTEFNQQGSTLTALRFDAQGQLRDQSGVAALNGPSGVAGEQAAGLPDGGYVVLYGVQGPLAPAPALNVREFHADGAPVGAAIDVGVGFVSANSIEVLSDGRYAITWQDFGSSHFISRAFTEADPASGAHNPPAPDAVVGPEAMVTVGDPVTLNQSQGWTSVAVLSNGALAIVGAQDGGWGSHVAAEQTYDSAGHETASATLTGYAPAGQALSPQITALQAGYYEVGYAGSSDYEIYNAADQQVFVHNAYTPPDAAFAPLLNGGYVTLRTDSGTYGVFDASNHNVAWGHYDGPSAPDILAYGNGDFLFSYPGTNRFDTLGPDGHDFGASHLDASRSGFASAMTAIPGGNFAFAWLSADNGQYGQPTSLRFEAYSAGTPHAIEVAQDLDPWHTQIQLQSHQDGSVAVLWSQGGAIWGAEYANQQAGGAHPVGIAGQLSDMVTIQLPGDQVGFAWAQGGQAWADIFDPASGHYASYDLGAASGDLSSVHALATADGGMAVSWHDGSVIDAALISGVTGQAGAPMPIAGDLLGVDAQGHAVTLHDAGGTPVLQTYGVNDTLFWHA